MRNDPLDGADWRQIACTAAADARPLLAWFEGLCGCANLEDLAASAALTRRTLVRFGAGQGGRGSRRTLARLLDAGHLPLWVAGVTMLPAVRVVRALWHPGCLGPGPEMDAAAARRQARELAARIAVVAYLATRGPAGCGPDTAPCLHRADARVLFAWLKLLTGLTLRELAPGTGVSHETLRRYAAGIWPVASRALPGLVEGLGGPVWVVEDVMVPAIRTVRLVAAHPRPENLLDGWEEALQRVPATVRVETVWYGAGELIAAAERAPGDRLWRLLQIRGAAARVRLAKRDRRFHRWELVVRLCEESCEAATESARAALRLALLALRVARRTRGEGLFDSALDGLALVHVANAWRALGQLSRAEQVAARGLALWEVGAAVAAGRLPAWRVLDLEASLLRDLRRFRPAIERLDTARALAPLSAWFRILLKKATVLDQQLEPEASLAVLQEAAPWMDERREPHHAYLWTFLFGVNQCHLGRYAEAQEVVPRAQALAAGLHKPLNHLRLAWLRGRIQAGLGNEGAALALLTAVQRAFRKLGMAFDFALVSLELGEVLLRQGRYDVVQALALEMEWIFDREGIHLEAEKALRLFRRAAEARSATPELAGQVVRYLYQAQHDPEARFAA